MASRIYTVSFDVSVDPTSENKEEQVAEMMSEIVLQNFADDIVMNAEELIGENVLHCHVYHDSIKIIS